jgi:hypothetical protein
MPEQNNLREEEVILSHFFRSFSPSWQRGCGRAEQFTRVGKSREKECLLSLHFPIHSIQGPQPNGDNYPILRAGYKLPAILAQFLIPQLRESE